MSQGERISTPAPMSAEQFRGKWPELRGAEPRLSKPDAIALGPDEAQNRAMSDVTRHEMNAALAASEARVAAAIAEMRSDNAKFLGELGAFKGEVLTALSGIKSDVTSGIAGVRADNAKEQVTSTRWQVGLIAAVILASASTIATVVLRTKPATPQQVVTPQALQQPAPIVIQLPAGQAAPPPTPQAGPAK